MNRKDKHGLGNVVIERIPWFAEMSMPLNLTCQSLAGEMALSWVMNSLPSSFIFIHAGNVVCLTFSSVRLRVMSDLQQLKWSKCTYCDSVSAWIIKVSELKALTFAWTLSYVFKLHNSECKNVFVSYFDLREPGLVCCTFAVKIIYIFTLVIDMPHLILFHLKCKSTRMRYNFV